MATGTGVSTINFGAAPGTNIASVAVTGQAGIVATDNVEVFMMGADSTTDHNAYEHMVAPLEVHLDASAVVAGTGFTITAITRLRLTGTFKVRWVWAT